MSAFILSTLWARRRRMVSTGAAVILGVAFLVAALCFGSTIGHGFNAMYREANHGTAVIVRGNALVGSGESSQRPTLPSSLGATIREVPGVSNLAPVVLVPGQILDRGGSGIGDRGDPNLAGNWIDDPTLNPYRLVEGRAPRDTTGGEPFEVVIDRGIAKVGDLHLGDRTTLIHPDPVDVVIVGIATFGDADSMGPVTYAGFARQATATLFGSGADAGQVTQFRVSGSAGVSPEQLRQTIQQVLPAGATAVTGAQLTAEQIDSINRQYLNVFQAVMAAFGGIALIVAALSIHNTFAIVVAQRTRESALLRAVGATRRLILTTVVAETAVIGAIASAIGVGVGYVLAGGLQRLLTATGGIDMGSTGTVLERSTAVGAFTAGVALTLIAGVGPAVAGSRTAPVAALREAQSDHRGSSRRRSLAGLLALVAGVGVMTLATRAPDAALMITGGGALLVILGAVLLAPRLIAPAAMVIGAPAALGQQGRLARANVVRHPRRTANAAAALMIGTAVVTLFATFGAGVRASVDRMVNQGFGGDLVVSARRYFSGGLGSDISRRIAALPEVARSVDFALGHVRLGDDDQYASMVDGPALATLLDVRVRQGSLSATGPGSIAISETYARRRQLEVGSVQSLTFPDGTSRQVTVRAIYADRSTMGDVSVNIDDARDHLRQMPIVAIMIDLAPGVSEQEGAAAVNGVTSASFAPRALTRSQYVASLGAELDEILSFIYGMLGVAVIIAVLSIANTLALSIHERTKEVGLLRAIGQSRRQVRSMVRWESVIVAVFGALLGIAVGLVLGWGLTRALAVQEGIGMFAAPTSSLGVILGLAVAAGVGAARRPARRAARLDVLAAMSGEHRRTGRRRSRALA